MVAKQTKQEKPFQDAARSTLTTEASIMEQNKKGKGTPTQPTVSNAWNGETNQTLEHALQSEQIQENFQQLQRFNEAHSIQKQGLPSIRKNNPTHTEPATDGRKLLEHPHLQQQMPGKDEHRPWGNTMFTPAASSTTGNDNSKYEDPTPKQNRERESTASDRNYPSKQGWGDRGDSNQEWDQLYRLDPLVGGCESPDGSSNLEAQTQPTLSTVGNDKIHHLTAQSTIWSSPLKPRPSSQRTQRKRWTNTFPYLEVGDHDDNTQRAESNTEIGPQMAGWIYGVGHSQRILGNILPTT
jgi:hypothetical protein